MLHLLTKKEKGLNASSRVFRAVWNLSFIILHLPPVSGQEDSVAHQKRPRHGIGQMSSWCSSTTYELGHPGLCNFTSQNYWFICVVKCDNIYLAELFWGRSACMLRVQESASYVTGVKEKVTELTMSMTQGNGTHIHKAPATCQGLCCWTGSGCSENLISMCTVAQTK